jgi:hypothetical protein
MRNAIIAIVVGATVLIAAAAFARGPGWGGGWGGHMGGPGYYGQRAGGYGPGNCPAWSGWDNRRGPRDGRGYGPGYGPGYGYRQAPSQPGAGPQAAPRSGIDR